MSFKKFVLYCQDEGYLARVRCIEVWCDMSTEFFIEQRGKSGWIWALCAKPDGLYVPKGKGPGRLMLMMLACWALSAKGLGS